MAAYMFTTALALLSAALLCRAETELAGFNLTTEPYTLDVASRMGVPKWKWLKPQKRVWARNRKNPPPQCFDQCHLYFWKNHRFLFNKWISDEFHSYSGKPNPWKWVPTDPMKRIGNWFGRQPGLFQPQNIYVEKWQMWNFGGLRILATAYPRDTEKYTQIFDRTPPGMQDTLESQGYEEYVTGLLSSKHAFKYGYFELRSHSMRTQLVNTWWFSGRSGNVWSEIDVYENSHVSKAESKWNVDMRPQIVPNAHAFYGPANTFDPFNMISVKPPWYTHTEPLAWKPHTHGLLWTPTKVTFFFEGKPYLTIPNKHWHNPLHMRIDVETNIRWHGIVPNVWKLNRHPELYKVMYFRAWSVGWYPEKRNTNKNLNSAARMTVHDVPDLVGHQRLASMYDRAVSRMATKSDGEAEEEEDEDYAVRRNATKTDMRIADWQSGKDPGVECKMVEKNDTDGELEGYEMHRLGKEFGKKLLAPHELSWVQAIKAFMKEEAPPGLWERMVDYFRNFLILPTL